MSRTPNGRGASSVIGVVLMVAVVVALSTAVGAFTLGLSPTDSVPQVGFTVTQDGVATDDESAVTVQFVHESGGGIETGNLAVRIDGTAAAELPGVSASMPANTLSSGETVTLSQNSVYGLTGGESVSLVYVNGDETAILATQEVTGQDPGASLSSLSFESGSPGDTTPPSPWEHVLGAQEGQMEIMSIATDGSQSLRVQGSSNTASGPEHGQNVGTTVDLSDVAEIQFDVYIYSEDGGQGELQFMVYQDGSRKKANTLSNSELATGTWLTDRSIDVSSISGTAMVIAHADGSNNEAAFDNVRFYDENGDRIPASEILAD